MLGSRDTVFGAGARAIGTDVRVLTTHAAALPSAHAILLDQLAELDQAASRFRSDSELSAINKISLDAAEAGIERVNTSVSQILADVLQVAIGAEQLTDGLVTPSIGAALVDLGYDADLAFVQARPTQTPSRHNSAAAAPITLRDNTLHLESGVILDIGAIGKSWAADRAARTIAEQLSCGVLVELGGDLACAGAPPLRGWRIGIVDWCGRTRQTVSAYANQCFATSSQMVRRWSQDNKERHHIVDPRTGQSAGTEWAQVTCIGPNATQANAASTAAMILGDQAIGWLADRDVPAMLINLAGHEYRVNGWPARLQPVVTRGTCS